MTPIVLFPATQKKADKLENPIATTKPKNVRFSHDGDVVYGGVGGLLMFREEGGGNDDD